MLISVPKAKKVNFSAHQIANTTAKFTRWKEFIKKNGYKPRAKISADEAKKTGMTEAERLAEMKCGYWAANVDRNANGNIEHETAWESPEIQQAEFNTLWEETPTYRQKNNTDNLNKLREFVKKEGHLPREIITKQQVKEIGKDEADIERELGQWANNIYQSIKGNIKSNPDWHKPEQQAEFEAIYKKYPKRKTDKKTSRPWWK